MSITNQTERTIELLKNLDKQFISDSVADTVRIEAAQVVRQLIDDKGHLTQQRDQHKLRARNLVTALLTAHELNLDLTRIIHKDTE